MRKINIRNMPHVKATLKSAHKIVYEDADTLIIYNQKAKTYIAEGVSQTIIDHLEKHQMTRLETTNKEVFAYFYATGNFKYHQICRQCYHKTVSGKTNLNVPNSEEIKWIAKTYGVSTAKIAAMSKNNKIFVYRKNGIAVSYVGIHIDGSVGFLYTKPEYRMHGYATKIEDELFKILDAPIFSQILEDNKESLIFHKHNNWQFNRYKIYWLFNEAF